MNFVWRKRRTLSAARSVGGSVNHLKNRLGALCVALAATAVCASALAQTTRIVVPFAAAGGLDAVGRVLAQKLQQNDQKLYVLENKPGATGLIGAKMVARAKPDGLTWLLQDSTSLTVNSLLQPDDPDFDEKRDLVPAAAVSFLPSVLVVHPGLGVRTLEDFVSKARTTQIAYGSGGIGSLGHLTMEYFAAVANIRVLHVAYKGGAPAMTDLLGGRLQAAFVALPVALPHIKGGALIPLAVSSRQREIQLPAVPTVAERGFPGFEVGTVYFVMLPEGTPGSIVSDVHARVEAALEDPETRQRIRAVGAEPAQRLTTAQAREWLSTERDKWDRVIRQRGLRADAAQQETGK